MPDLMSMYVIVLITCPGKEESEAIAGVLLKERLIACANIIPSVTSFFWWTGKIHKADESMIIAKTKKSSLRQLIQRVKKIHQYENPEIIALPVIGGSKEYMKWIEDETK
jgi:periplasmic divalent cation tolerance protein